MIIIGICDTQNNRSCHHDTGLRLLGYMLKRFCHIDNLDGLKYSEKNKPYIHGAEFSISHSYHLVVCAVHCDGYLQDTGFKDDFDNLRFITINTVFKIDSLGVDVEYIDKEKSDEYRNIADKKFFDGEIGILNDCPNDDYVRRFCSFWTAKESYSKFTGIGLTDALMFDASLHHDGLEFFCDYICDGADEYSLSLCFNSDLG